MHRVGRVDHGLTTHATAQARTRVAQRLAQVARARRAWVASVPGGMDRAGSGVSRSPDALAHVQRELSRKTWLREEEVRAGLARSSSRLGLVERAQCDDTDTVRRRIRLEPARGLPAVDVRHREIHDHDRRHQLPRQRHALRRVRCLDDAKPGALEMAAVHGAVVCPVVDDQDERGAVGGNGRFSHSSIVAATARKRNAARRRAFPLGQTSHTAEHR